MRAIFDENVPQAFARSLQAGGIFVERFPKVWKGLQNGRLVARLKAEGFKCLITCDRNLVFQQAIGDSGLCVLVLPSTKLAELEPLVAAVAEALVLLRAGQAASLRPDGRLVVS